MPAPRKLDYPFLSYLQNTFSESQILLRSLYSDTDAFRESVSGVMTAVLADFPFAVNSVLEPVQQKLLDQRIRDECCQWFDPAQLLIVRRAYNQHQYRLREEQITGAGKSHRAGKKAQQLKPGQVVGVSEGTAALIDRVMEDEGMDSRDEVINWLCRSYFADQTIGQD